MTDREVNATPHTELLAELMNPNIPKNEREHAAVREIERLRETLEQPEQQAEPVSMRMPKVGDKVICLEDESLGTVESLTAGGSPDILFDDGSHGTYLLREFAELFGYVAPPQQQAEPPPEHPWVGLTDEEATKIWESTGDRDSWELLKRVEAKLKERNT